jgi:helix-turn-helix protein
MCPDEAAGGHGPAPPDHRDEAAEPAGSFVRDLIERLRRATDGINPREIAARTGYHPETVRRYFRRGRLSLRFFAAICEQFGISPEWLLWGSGPMRERSHAARPSEPPLVVTASFEVKDGSVVVKGLDCRRAPKPAPAPRPGQSGRDAPSEAPVETKRRGGDSNPR